MKISHLKRAGIRKELTPDYCYMLAKEMLADPYRNYYLTIDLSGKARLVSAYPGQQPVIDYLSSVVTLQIATPEELAGWSSSEQLGATLWQCVTDWLNKDWLDNLDF